MKSINKIENKIDYLLTVISYVFLFITTKEILPLYIYSLFALAISLYFFPARLIMNLKENISKENKINLIVTGLIFSLLLIFSILNLYIPNDTFFKYTIYTLSFINFGFIIFYYMKHNQFLLLNFIFGFVASLMI